LERPDPDDGPEEPTRLRLPDEPVTMRTTRSPRAGVLTSGRCSSCRDSGLSSGAADRSLAPPVLLGGRAGAAAVRAAAAPVDLDMDVERRFEG